MGQNKTAKASKYLFYLIFSLFIGYSQEGYSQPQAVENNFIHEAFVTPVSANLVFEASPVQPPSQINERIPKQLDMQAEWIPGYWAWEPKLRDYFWVSGVWRRPPPGHQWISGFWKKYDEEWVWIRGLWSRIPEQNLEYIGILPPEPADQNIAPPPSENYFWVPGFWYFLFDQQEYQWVLGQWEELDADWVFVPSNYIWRPGGYVFIPAYWDWPLENRGTAYSTLAIEPGNSNYATFEPIRILRTDMIVRTLFINYPDYLCLFHHHWHFHPDFWQGFCCQPPWWGWDTWWSLAWNEQWSLWWWYTHPGYPQPLWMTPELSSILPHPLSELLAMFKYANPPAIITPYGAVSGNQLLSAVAKVTGQFLPILPTDTAAQNKVFRIAMPGKVDPSNTLKPIGRRLPVDPTAIRPHVRKPVTDRDGKLYPHTISDSLRPALPYKPKLPSNRRSTQWKTQPNPFNTPTYTPPIRRPNWSPRQVPQAEGSRTGVNTPVRVGPTIIPNQKHRQVDQLNPSEKWRPMDPYQKSRISRPPVHISPPEKRWKREAYPKNADRIKSKVHDFSQVRQESDDDEISSDSDD